MEFTLGEEKGTTFRQAVERVTALAHAKLPAELHGHLERATALVLQRHVWMDEDGRHGQVLSSDGTTWYVCNGHCTCMGATKAPQGLCKHRLAFGLYRRASELLAAAACAARAPAAGVVAPVAATVDARDRRGDGDFHQDRRGADHGRLCGTPDAAERLGALTAGPHARRRDQVFIRPDGWIGGLSR